MEYVNGTAPAVNGATVEYCTTCDLPDGQACPPFIENNIPWRVVMRVGGHTIWCRPSFISSSVSAWRTASEAQSRAPQEQDKWI
jgi:hypothetical protein